MMKFTLPPSTNFPSTSSSSATSSPIAKIPRLKRKPKPLSPTAVYNSGFEIARPKSSPSAFPASTVFQDEQKAKNPSPTPKPREQTPPPPLPHVPIPASPAPKLSSLIISPDLDALLAHDELMRKRQNRVRAGSRSPRTSSAPVSPRSPRSQSSVGSLSPVSPRSGTTHTPNTSFGSFKAFVHSPVASGWGSGSGGITRVVEEEEENEEPVLQSLPAPPAKRRNGRRATVGGDERSERNLPPPPSPTLTNRSHTESFQQMENPYINPSPSIEDVLRMKTLELSEHPTIRQPGNQSSTQHQTVAHCGSHLSEENAATEFYKSEHPLLSHPNNTSKGRGKLVKEKARRKDAFWNKVSDTIDSDTFDTEVRTQADGNSIPISNSSSTSTIYPQENSFRTQRQQLHYNDLQEMNTTSNEEPWRQRQPGSRQTDSHAPIHAHSKSTTLSDYHFVDEDPYSPPPGSTSFTPLDSTEDAARISISSTVYPATNENDITDDEYHDYYNELAREEFEVIPTPRSATRPTGATSNAEGRISFIELTSPTFPPEDDPRGRPNMSFRDRSPNGSTGSGSGSKPPIPTTPKPDFTTPHLKSSSRKSKSKKSSPRTEDEPMGELPPTTNYLAAEERADLVRKSRKLTRVFGQTPRGNIIGPGTLNTSAGDSPSGRSFLDISPTRHRSAFSIASSVEVRPHAQQQTSTYTYTTPHSASSLAEKRLGHNKSLPKAVWPPPVSGTQYLTAGGRRHSTPMTPDEFEFLSDLHRQDDITTGKKRSMTEGEAGDEAASDDGYEREQETEEEADLIEIGTQEGDPRASTSIGHDLYSYSYGQLAGDSQSEFRRGSTKGAPVASPSVMSFMDLSDGPEEVARALTLSEKGGGSGAVESSRKRGDDENFDTKEVARDATTKKGPAQRGDSDPGTSARAGAPSIVSIGVTRNTHPTELTELESLLSDPPVKRARNRKVSDSSSSALSGRTSSTSLSSITFAPTNPHPNSLGFAPNARSGSGAEAGSSSGPPVVPSNFDSFSSSTLSLQHKYSLDNLFDEAVLPPTSVPGPSLYRSLSLLSLTPEELADEEKRRKREKLAKLHRFLGSRVPTNLVLGIDTEDIAYTLPPEMDHSNSASGSGDEGGRKVWLRRRRSSLSGALDSGAGWSDAVDRVKDDLGDEERMVNVRRAVKMEKVFGVAPPQTLYHTRGHAPSASVSAANVLSSKTSGFVPPKTLRSSSGDGSAKASPSSCLPNSSGNGSNTSKSSSQKSSSNKPKKQKEQRPGTADSTKELLPKGDTISAGSGSGKGLEDGVKRARASLVYTHYQHSLNSLNDILDRDDRESLAELHDYLNNTDLDANLDFGLGRLDLNNVDVDLAPLSPGIPPPSTSSSGIVTGRDRAMSNASIRSERRRSLPARTSLISLSSQSIQSFDIDMNTPTTATMMGVSSPDANRTAFQTRRRRAAKLTQFFGVNYRDLIRDVLESIENGLEHERKRGTIGVEEAEDLLQKLRTIKTKRDGLF